MQQNQSIHEVLAKSYLVYFVASLVGLFIDSFISVPITVPFATSAAIVLFGAGPLLMAWAQYVSRHCEKDGHPHRHYFHHGPYKYVRNPTHLGLLLLVTGYTLVSGSLVFFCTTLLGYLISNGFFKKYERLIHHKFGEAYAHYKSKVKKLL